MTTNPLVAIVMGSDSDLETLRPGADLLAEFGIPHEVRVVSAHRTPERMFEFAKTAESRGLQVIIAGAGGAVCAVAHLRQCGDRVAGGFRYRDYRYHARRRRGISGRRSDDTRGD